ncbi:V-type ATP synthase subunit F [Oscillospiraceae bacterium PP1C4]
MKFYTLSDNIDTLMGMRLAGIEGENIHTADEVLEALKRVMADPEIGVVLMTENLINSCPHAVYRYKLTQKRPLIVEIPDRHGSGDVSQLIGRYVSEAIGIKL